MARLKLILAYTGTRYAGWQIQPNARTVQAVLETALERICKQFVRVQGSSRTDAGVHALGQVAHCDVPDRLAGIPWIRALNGQLPKDVSVLSAEIVDDSFHSRFATSTKSYLYSMWLRGDYVLPQRLPFVWHTGPLDVEAMDAAAELLVGRLDFKSFQNVGTPVRSTVRRVTEITRLTPDGADELVWRITADGFLKQMVRNIMGCLVAAGRGKIAPEDVREIQQKADRTQAPPTALAAGLCLEEVRYGVKFADMDEFSDE